MRTERGNLIFSLCLLVFPVLAYGFQPAFAFTYTTKNSDFFQNVSSSNFTNVYVYAGDVELYCRGSGGSSPSTACVFTGPNTNSYVYYTDYAKQAVNKYTAAGLNVWINFDGRIGDYVPNFDRLTTDEMKGLATATASIVCGENNVGGMGWDVEPFDNNQLTFFQELDDIITACNKKWGIFTFAEKLNEQMWTTGLGKSGILLDSTYDLSCPTCNPCKCVPPTPRDAQPGQGNYQDIFTSHLQTLQNLCQKYQKPYQLFIAGGGTTQMYQVCTLADCSSMGGGPVYNRTCPWRMSDWLNSLLSTIQKLSVKSDPNFFGAAVYDWSEGSNGGFLPNEPQGDFIQLLKQAGLM